jgi:hypothetical protein
VRLENLLRRYTASAALPENRSWSWRRDLNP